LQLCPNTVTTTAKLGCELLLLVVMVVLLKIRSCVVPVVPVVHIILMGDWFGGVRAWEFLKFRIP
jgi:hypothetical protein